MYNVTPLATALQYVMLRIEGFVLLDQSGARLDNAESRQRPFGERVISETIDGLVIDTSTL